MVETIVLFLTENSVVLGSVGAVCGTAAIIWGIVKAPFKRDKPVALDPQTIAQIKPTKAKDGPTLTITEFIRIRRELKAEIEAELATAPDEEKEQLRARIAELERQIADPEPALADAKARIADLETRLERLGNEIGGDRLAEARAALEKGDYSVADDLFAEVEARTEMEVQNAARAAFGRGEIAEAEVRWGEAAEHYAKAARLEPGVNTCHKAADFAWRSGKFAAALQWGEDALKLARADDDPIQLALMLDRSATYKQWSGDYSAAAPNFHEALEMRRRVLGDRHYDVASSLNNLAALLQNTGRFEDAEPLFREALEIGREVLDDRHPNVATQLNNLAILLQATGRFEEAEPLYREALEIGREV
ncbi:tetratricopeptide repeat protein, partial [uncultured Tateyamaria sp.]